ncbi:MAG: beta-agarase [Gammaproteobacteria bacterium]|nr:beta-agarase [Gammaproteobacteria bacterium]MBU2154874.1 beta-agarase [Gammaproteobacteria bacterium]MBU2256231.1 beta-agarase [Gammaproteobacteria bacterium]MBU2293324.1 beta-agarase [Gammaproteobacteria bacterium]
MATGPQELFNFVRPMDAVQVTTQDADLPNRIGEPTPQGEVLRRVTFHPAEQPSLRLTPQNGSWDWSQQTQVSLRVQNAMDWALTLDVLIESTDGQRLSTRIALPAGPAQTLLIPLQAASPRDQGMRAGVPMPWTYKGQRLLLADTVSGALDLSKVSAVTLSMPQPKAAQHILISQFGVTDEQFATAAYAGIVDSYGQYARADWPGKVKNDEQLQQAVAQEQKQLHAWLAERPAQDKFAGWTGGQPFEASGFFRTEKRDGRWYLVTPEGHPFYSLGVNAVTTQQSATYVEGREAMFAGLPQPGEALAAYFGTSDSRSDTGANQGRAFASGRWFDFYKANLQRSYGQLDPAAWRTLSQDRLQAWGFNTLGNWSDPTFGGDTRMPFSIPLSIHGDYATISTGVDWWGAMPDPFDPRFAMATERAVAIASRDHRENPWLLGYFADNELAWAGPADDPNGRYALAYATLRLSTDVPAKRAFLKQLRDKYRNHNGLSRAWGIELPAWELMEDPGFQAPLPSAEFPAIEKDMQAFLRLYAATYFKTIADSLDWHAPNHLLLGGRFASSIPEAVNACAEFCDVLSFNFYTREPQHGYDFAALRQLDKPLMVTEFHFGSRDRGPFWGGVAEVYKEEERGPAYAHFLAKALEEPQIVGLHWFQYLDQPVTGRLLDGENGHLGLVGITDRPWDGFVKAVRKANLDVPKTLLETVSTPVPAVP